MTIEVLSKPVPSIQRENWLYEKPMRLHKPVSKLEENEDYFYEEDPPLESDWHVLAMVLLLEMMEEFFKDRDDVYISGNTAVYFDPNHKKNRHFRGPDFYVIKNVAKGLRHSWTTWEEGGLTPNIVIELASKSTAKVDLGEKKAIYEQQLKTPEYVIYNPQTDELLGWRLKGGYYQPITPNKQGWLWCEELDLWLGVVEHDFSRASGLVKTPRFFHKNGKLLLTQKEVEIQRAERAEKRAKEAEREKEAEAQARIQVEKEKEAEAQARIQAETEIARLKALLKNR